MPFSAASLAHDIGIAGVTVTDTAATHPAPQTAERHVSAARRFRDPFDPPSKRFSRSIAATSPGVDITALRRNFPRGKPSDPPLTGRGPVPIVANAAVLSVARHQRMRPPPGASSPMRIPATWFRPTRGLPNTSVGATPKDALPSNSSDLLLLHPSPPTTNRQRADLTTIAPSEPASPERHGRPPAQRKRSRRATALAEARRAGPQPSAAEASGHGRHLLRHPRISSGSLESAAAVAPQRPRLIGSEPRKCIGASAGGERSREMSGRQQRLADSL